jgi:hypothetical protein
VLKVLSNPSHPDLVPKLRFAASTINLKNVRDLHLWLKGGLFAHLLRILEALPTLKLSPTNAADVCAPTVAVLCNVLQLSFSKAANLPPAVTPQSLVAAAGALDVLAPVVQFGMLGAAAQEPLAGPKVHIENLEQLLELYKPRVDTGQLASPCGRKPPVRTPLHVCGYLLMLALMLDLQVAGKEGAFEDAVKRMSPAVGPLVDTGIFRHLLEAAVEDPGGTGPCIALTQPYPMSAQQLLYAVHEYCMGT